MKTRDETRARLIKLVKGTGDDCYDRLVRVMITAALEQWCGRALNIPESEYGNQIIAHSLMRDIAKHINETAVL